MYSLLLAPTEIPPEANRKEFKSRREALAALSEWQEAYLGNSARRSEFERASAIPSEHMGRNMQLMRIVAEGARYLGGPCSQGVMLPTRTQDRYEYVILARYIEELRHASTATTVSLPPNVLFGSLPTGYPTAQTMRAPRTDHYLVLFRSGLFGYLYILGRIVASCIPYRRDREKIGYMLTPSDIIDALANSDDNPSRYLTPASAAERLGALLRSCVCQGTPWASPPTRVKKFLIPVAESLVDASQAFVVGHEFAHLMNHDLDQPRTIKQSLGSTDTADFVQHNWHDEMSADFVGIQAAFAACTARDQPTLTTYAGADLYLRGVQLLYDTVALMLGREEGDFDNHLWPPITKRRLALRNGVQYYLSQGAQQLIPRELAFADAVVLIMNELWNRCRLIFKGSNVNTGKIAPVWRSILEGAQQHDKPNDPTRVTSLGEQIYDLLEAAAHGNRRGRTLLQQVAPAVAVILFQDLTETDEVISNKAVHWLMNLDAEVEEHIPLIRWTISRMSPDERLGDNPILIEMIKHFTICINRFVGDAEA